MPLGAVNWSRNNRACFNNIFFNANVFILLFLYSFTNFVYLNLTLEACKNFRFCVFVFLSNYAF